GDPDEAHDWTRAHAHYGSHATQRLREPDQRSAGAVLGQAGPAFSTCSVTSITCPSRSSRTRTSNRYSRPSVCRQRRRVVSYAVFFNTPTPPAVARHGVGSHAVPLALLGESAP